MENSKNVAVAPGNSFCKNVRTYFREYCNCTSIHGFRYFGEKRTIFERVWWIVIFLICLTACASSIYGVYKKWEGSPVIVNFANQGTPIYNIPFPAVTICPESKSDQNNFSYTKIMQKKINKSAITPEEDLMFEYMSHVCKYFSKVNYSNPDEFPEAFFDVLHSVRSPLLLWNCMYLGSSIPCDKLFVPIITDEGICYTFNMLDRSEIYKDSVIQFRDYQRCHVRKNWSVREGYAPNAGLTAYPRRALFAGAANGLTLNIVTPQYFLDYGCRTSSLQGYKVLLHSPMRVPRPSQQYFRVPLDQSVVGAVQPVMISTSEKVQMYYNARKRGCHFPSERDLKFFKIYTSLNCKIECLTNYTLKRCGCVNFYMPRENGTKICGTGKIYCMRQAENFMQVQDLYLKLEDSKSVWAMDCQCLPICTDVTYEVETSQTDWDWRNSYRAHMATPANGIHLSSLTIFFKSDNFITSERNELYGPIDFLANFGGLLGLFTGFSILSLMEILYFLSIRLICNNRLYGYWAGPEN